MLEFIVLGQIPGTHLQITLAWFVFAILGLLIWADIKFHAQKRANQSSSKGSNKTANPSRA